MVNLARSLNISSSFSKLVSFLTVTKNGNPTHIFSSLEQTFEWKEDQCLVWQSREQYDVAMQRVHLFSFPWKSSCGLRQLSHRTKLVACNRFWKTGIEMWSLSSFAWVSTQIINFCLNSGTSGVWRLLMVSEIPLKTLIKCCGTLMDVCKMLTRCHSLA